MFIQILVYYKQVYIFVQTFKQRYNKILIVMTIEQIKQKIEYGDYNQLQKVLKAPTVAAARARFLRGNSEAVKAMQAIQENKEKFIKEYTENQ